MYSLLHFSLWFQHFGVAAVVNHYFIAPCPHCLFNSLEKLYLKRNPLLADIHRSLLGTWQFPGELNPPNPRKPSAVLPH